MISTGRRPGFAALAANEAWYATTSVWAQLRRTWSDDRMVPRYAVALGATLFLVLLLGTLHAADDTGATLPAFDLSRDRSLAEVFGYALSGTATVWLLAAWWRTSVTLFLAFALLFAFALIDDAASYHERVARHVLVPLLDPPALPGMRRQDTGELMAWALAGAALAVPFILALRQRATGRVGVLIALSVPVGLLCAFGIGADMLHSFVDGRLANTVLGLIEDGGELVALALASALAFAFARAPMASAPPGPVRRGLERPMDARRAPDRPAEGTVAPRG